MIALILSLRKEFFVMKNYLDFENVHEDPLPIENLWEDDFDDDFDNEESDVNLDSINMLFGQVRKSTPLSKEEFQRLIQERDAGNEEAISQIVEANLRLVIYCAKRFARNQEELMDLFQSGCLGLIKAAQSYSASRNCQFSTYAVVWILETIQRQKASCEKTVHLSIGAHYELKRLIRAREDYFKLNGEWPTYETLSELAKVPLKHVAILMEYEHIHSLDSLVLDSDTDDPASMMQFVSSSENVEDIVIAKLSDNLFDEIKQILPAREFQVLAYHYGYQGNTPLSFAKISRIMGLTRERIRQIELHAFKLLKKNKQFVKKYGKNWFVS